MFLPTMSQQLEIMGQSGRLDEISTIELDISTTKFWTKIAENREWLFWSKNWNSNFQLGKISIYFSRVEREATHEFCEIFEQQI